jgi:hypothetical protein
MPNTLQVHRRLPLATLAVLLLAVWGCGRDAITGPSSRSGATPLADISPTNPLPPTLTGEGLAGTGRFVQRGDCRTGPVAVDYLVRGPAGGPYPGTFVEVGRVLIQGFIVGFEAGFFISSPAGLVTGRKTFESMDIGITCLDGRVVFVSAAGAEVTARYTAIIRTRSGTFRDAGSTEIDLTGVSDHLVVGEGFGSDGSATVPVSPDDD